MARAQIKLATDNSYYTFPINPVEFDSKDYYEYNVNTTIDGKSIEQYSYYDGRERTMIWKNLPNRPPYAGDATSLVNKLKTFVRAGECHLLLNDLDTIGGTGPRKSIKITNLRTELSPGAGPYTATGHLKYSVIELKYVEIVPES